MHPHLEKKGISQMLGFKIPSLKRIGFLSLILAVAIGTFIYLGTRTNEAVAQEYTTSNAITVATLAGNWVLYYQPDLGENASEEASFIITKERGADPSVMATFSSSNLEIDSLSITEGYALNSSHIVYFVHINRNITEDAQSALDTIRDSGFDPDTIMGIVSNFDISDLQFEDLNCRIVVSTDTVSFGMLASITC